MYIYIVYAKYNQASSSNHVEVTALSPVIVIGLQGRRHERFIGGGGRIYRHPNPPTLKM